MKAENPETDPRNRNKGESPSVLLRVTIFICWGIYDTKMPIASTEPSRNPDTEGVLYIAHDSVIFVSFLTTQYTTSKD